MRSWTTTCPSPPPGHTMLYRHRHSACAHSTQRKNNMAPPDLQTANIAVPTPAHAPGTKQATLDDARPFGSVVKGKPIKGPQVWYGRDIINNLERHVHRLTPEQITDLETAIAAVEPRLTVEGTNPPFITNLTEVLKTKDDFPLPHLAPLLETVLKEVSVHGQGWSLIKGLPVDRWTRQQSVIAYAGIALYLGKLKPQNEGNHIIGHVKDTGVDPEHKNITTRIYLTRVAQPWHVDGADVAGLLCLKTALEGGLSSFASSAALYNEVLARRPDLIDVLSGPGWSHTWNDRHVQGLVHADKLNHEFVKRGWHDVPVFNFPEDGTFAAHLQPHAYQIAELDPYNRGVPKLTPKHKEAWEFVVSLLEDRDTGLAADFFLEPGDIEFVNNFTALHTRTAFTDHQEVDKKRHLVRLWLSLPAEYANELAGSGLAHTYLGVGPKGDRGGIQFKDKPLTCPLEAETPY